VKVNSFVRLLFQHRPDEVAHAIRTPSSIPSKQLSKSMMSAATAAGEKEQAAESSMG
jgi:hypothetical protein